MPVINTRISTDVSHSTIECTLSVRIQDNSWVEVGHFVHTLLPNELNYNIVELECLAIIYAIETFHDYLCNVPFEILTDNLVIANLNNIQNPQGIILLLLICFQVYQCYSVYS